MINRRWIQCVVWAGRSGGARPTAKYLVDDNGIGDVGDHPKSAAAVRAESHVEVEYALEPLRPGQG